MWLVEWFCSFLSFFFLKVVKLIVVVFQIWRWRLLSNIVNLIDQVRYESVRSKKESCVEILLVELKEVCFIGVNFFSKSDR